MRPPVRVARPLLEIAQLNEGPLGSRDSERQLLGVTQPRATVAWVGAKPGRPLSRVVRPPMAVTRGHQTSGHARRHRIWPCRLVTRKEDEQLNQGRNRKLDKSIREDLEKKKLLNPNKGLLQKQNAMLWAFSFSKAYICIRKSLKKNC